MVCFNQDERVAGLISEVCPFLKEMKRRDREPLRSLVRSNSTSRSRTGHKVLSSLNCLSTMVVKAGIVTGDTLCEPSLASWLLAMKSEEGNKAIWAIWAKDLLRHVKALCWIRTVLFQRSKYSQASL